MRVVSLFMLNNMGTDGGRKPSGRLRGSFGRMAGRAGKRLAATKAGQAVIAGRYTLLLSAMAFLLGRAMIFEELSPFAAALFAVVYFSRRESLFWVGGFLFMGSMWSAEPQSGFLLAEMAVFYCVQKALERFERSEVSYAPTVVLFAVFSVKLFAHAVQTGLTWYHLMMTAVEGALAFVLTLIFLQAIPLIVMPVKNRRLQSEEIVCLIILLASVMTGAAAWMAWGFSVEHVLSRYLIILFALAGGAPLGASAGVVTGLILSLSDVAALSEMSVLAFSGMLAGLLKDGRKPGVAAGLLIGSAILAMYAGDRGTVLRSAAESAAAIFLLAVTPRRFIRALSSYVPGTMEYARSQHDYARRVRDLTAERVEQFSEVFRQLAASFKQFAHEGEAIVRGEDARQVVSDVAGAACSACWKRKKCWEDGFHQTWQYMSEMLEAVESDPALDRRAIREEWRRVCVKPEQVLERMKRRYGMYRHDLIWKKQICDSRRLVADQLAGVSQVMLDLAREIKREGREMARHEAQIRSALEQLGLSIHSVEVISLDVGHVEIEIVHRFSRGYDECRKIIAPLLSDILGENIVVKSERVSPAGKNFRTVTFGSAKEFEVETGIAGAAKGGDILSGDSFHVSELWGGKFAVAVSDGMGNGERAKLESAGALSILKQLLQSGMDEKLAVKSVNSVLLLRSSDEVFTTIDLALIDLYTARTTFLKIGSTPSFIKRGREVIPVTASNLPVGIVQDIDVDLITLQLRPRDMLILMTDGVYDAPGPAVNKELWMKRLIQEVEGETPQDVADCLLEAVVRYNRGEIADDMTVVVARIDRYKPEWASVRVPFLSRAERPKTVS